MVSSGERDAIRRLSAEEKANVLALYLIGTDGNTYTMGDVARKLYKNSEQGRRVSMICRAYGFHGRNNSGRYHPGSAACRKLRREITPNDFVRFVAKYPNGITSENENFDHFLGIAGCGVHGSLHQQQVQPELRNSHLDNSQQWDSVRWYDSRSKRGVGDESDTYHSDDETHPSPFNFSNVTLPSAFGGIAFFAMFWHAAKFYFRAGRPFSWSIIAGLIAIFGGLFIFFRMYKNNR